MKIDDMARARYEAGCDMGMSAEPWADADRDHVADIREELADALNYVRFETRARGEDAALAECILFIRHAWNALDAYEENNG